jgi:NAD(P)-dependent dehydrogenase (short-subunit alcohol dehydrogenase family)
MFKLDGKVAMVTGSATGIGAAISVALAQSGADVAISDRPGVNLEETASKIKTHGRKVFTFGMDVGVISQIKDGIKAVVEEFGRIDILVNNAGIAQRVPGLEVTEKCWDEHFNINVKGSFFISQAVAKLMIEQKWGRIIFISSQSGLVGVPGQPVYCTTKAAVIHLARALGLEWAKHGITVNSIAPTFVETNLTRKRLQDPEFLKFVLGKIPIGKLALPEHIAAAAVYLSSEEAAMVNCATLSVDGGWTAW